MKFSASIPKIENDIFYWAARNIADVSFSFFLLSSHFFSYSFAGIVLIIDKNNTCKYRSSIIKIEKNDFSIEQHS